MGTVIIAKLRSVVDLCHTDHILRGRLGFLIFNSFQPVFGDKLQKLGGFFTGEAVLLAELLVDVFFSLVDFLPIMLDSFSYIF